MNKKYRASSLLETLAALVIISILFYLSISIFLNITSSSITLSKLKAELLHDKLFHDIITEGEYFDKEKVVDNFRCQILIENTNDLISVRIIISDLNNTIISDKKEVTIHE